jgi:hypothetical protein
MVGLDPAEDYGGVPRGGTRDLEKLDLERWWAGVLPSSYTANISAHDRESAPNTSLHNSGSDEEAMNMDEKIPATVKREQDATQANSIDSGRTARRRIPWWKRRPLILFNLSPRSIRTIWTFNVIVFGYLLLFRPFSSTITRKPLETHLSYMTHSNPLISIPWRWVFAPPEATREYMILEKRRDLDFWIEGEKKLAWEKIAGNIGPSAGAGDGIVIASPSIGDVASEPDYYVSLTLSVLRDPVGLRADEL